MVKRAFQLGFVFLLTLTMTAQWASTQEEGRVPAYNPPPAKGAKLPPILPTENLWGQNSQYPYQTHAYELAAKIPSVIYQMPCYCYCDRMGHKSLHSCFEGSHGAECATCLKELYYTYEQTKKKKTVAQVRQGIIKGEWKQIDLEAAATMN
jgi:hypothetical protein